MATVLITGSSSGLGLMAAERLLAAGHRVVLHARNDGRADDVRQELPGVAAVVTGDLSSLQETRALAEQINALGHLDAIIHNAGVGFRAPRRIETSDGLCETFQVNVVAPYLLTALVTPPARLVYLSSAMQFYAEPRFDDLQWTQRRWDGSESYGETKLYVAALAFAVARRWPHVLVNTMTPGWVPTRMGGTDAPDDLELGSVTQAWLAVSDEPAAQVSGSYFYHQREERPNPAARDAGVQAKLLRVCAEITGVELPEPPAA
jgi:NAD(P)-dependent dehydrogenase (short-subunit alcohol dehydrogenase family)